LLLREQFTELLRDDSNKQRPAAYVQLLQESETAAQRLEAYLAREETDLSSAAEREEARKLLLEVSNRCAACHQAYRDPAGSR
jgi:cytochrome c556